MSEIETLPSEIAANDLNFQQEQFVLEWMANGGNATQAAIAAGYSHPDVQGSRLLGNVKVVKYIEALRAERRARLDLQMREKHFSKDKVLADLCTMAGFDLGDLLDGQGRIDRTRLKAHAKQLQAVEIDGAKTKIKGPDRLAAYKLLADLMGWSSKTQVNVQVNVGFAELMAARRAKVIDQKP